MVRQCEPTMPTSRSWWGRSTGGRDGLYQALKAHGVHARRYFYPLVSDFPMYRNLPSAAAANLPVATRAAQQIVCLPIYPDLSAEDQQRVIDVVLEGA